MSANRDSVLNSFKTIIEMFQARERPDVAEQLQHIGESELDGLLRSKNVFSLTVPDKLRIVYYLEPKLKVPDLRAVINDDEVEYANTIIVLREKTTSANINSIHDMVENVQVFEIRELQFNISKHKLVPKHRLIDSSSDIINTILQRLNIKSRSQLPIILRSDPMAKFLNAKPGDLVEITRFSPTSAEHVFYRMCV